MIGYIEIPLTRKSRETLTRMVRAMLDEKEYCFLKRKGGIVTERAHLTLFFGLKLHEIKERALAEAVASLPSLALLPDRPSIFRLGRAPCAAFVLLLKETKELKEAHARFTPFPHVSTHPFRPHITLAYVRKNWQLPAPVPPLPAKLPAEYARVRIFGAHVQHA